MRNTLYGAAFLTAASVLPAAATTGDHEIDQRSPEEIAAQTDVCLNRNAMSHIMMTFFTQTQQPENYAFYSTVMDPRGEFIEHGVNMRSEDAARKATAALKALCERDPKVNLMDLGPGRDFGYGIDGSGAGNPDLYIMDRQ